MNGRVGSLALNWIKGTLASPIHSPDWEDPNGYWPESLGPRRATGGFAPYYTVRASMLRSNES